ncbi:alpha/beta fold hydrolase [Brucella pseudogrignonensis]|uniref:alpha/beta fold hydrolase n=1 Tax=Brucella pseudogrignonensis TaxID=419475 RepID=UPI00124E9F64|nr:alpha/beta fold hydrolase [Brucella pseudogrignonensis]KAB2689507.1 lipase [Brucella pseudogrignonensis]
MKQSVTRRALFFIGGYDPKSPEAFFGRMRKEVGRFDQLWGTTTAVSDLRSDTDRGSVTITTESRSEGWSTQNDFTFLALDKLVLSDFNRPLFIRLIRYLAAFSSFILEGSALRFFRKAWRFGLYFIYPFMTLVAFALFAAASTLLLSSWLGFASIAIGLLVFFIALSILGRRWSTLHLMDLWSFSSQFMHGQRPDAEALLQDFAGSIVRAVGSARYDEIILIGHSTGGMLILDVAARCVSLDTGFSQRAPKVSILTLGSTALKAGYCKRATAFRQQVSKLVAEPSLQWVEIQCLTDPINFYKTDPVKEMNLPQTRRDFPLIRTVRMKEMLQPETYRRIKRNFFRVHYQYIFGNTKAYWYDFFQICCGPTTLEDRAKNHVVGNRQSCKEGCP